MTCLMPLHKKISAQSVLPSGGIIKTNLTRGVANKLYRLKNTKGMTCLMPLHKYQRKMDCRVGDKNKKNFHSKNLTGGGRWYTEIEKMEFANRYKKYGA